MPIEQDPVISSTPKPEQNSEALPLPELIVEASEDLGERAVGETVFQPMTDEVRVLSRDERAALRTAEPTIAEVMSQPAEAVPRPEKGDKVLALFDGRVVEAVVDKNISSDGATAHEQVFTVIRANNDGSFREKTMPVALFKPEIQADLARRQAHESFEESTAAVTTQSEALAEAMGSESETKNYDHLLDPDYEGGSVEEAAVYQEADEGERLARERAKDDHLANVVNKIDFQRRGY